MTAGYKRPHITMNRPKYGNTVKVVKQSRKIIKPQKPSVLALKRIYAKLTKAATWQKLDILAEAIQWYREALRYCHTMAYEINKTGYSVQSAAELRNFNTVALSPILRACPDERLCAALKSGKLICATFGVKTPAILPYLQKGKKVAKKLDVRVTELSNKYDKLLTLFTQAYGDGLTLKVSPTLAEDRKFDHVLNTLFYSTKHIKVLRNRFLHDGLLPIVIDEAWYTARAQAFMLKEKTEKNSGVFLTTELTQALIYQKILTHFAQWASISPYAPKSLVKRLKPKKKQKAS